MKTSLLARTLVATVLFAAASPATTSPATAATVAATYTFDNTLAAEEPGQPALTAVDPLAVSGFVGDTVYGSPRTVWNFNGSSATALQGGLSVGTSGVISPDSYSVELVFLFDNLYSFRRVLDVQDRQSDTGLYVWPGDQVGVYGGDTVSGVWSEGYHHVVLTNDGAEVNVYLDGALTQSTVTDLMDLNNFNNPGLLLNFFLDDTAFSGEWSPGRAALIRLWDGALTAEQVDFLAFHPFSVPEPSSIALAMLGACGTVALVRAKNRRAVSRLPAA